MTTQTIETSAGAIPSPTNWGDYYLPNDNSPVIFLEKATDGRTTLDDILASEQLTHICVDAAGVLQNEQTKLINYTNT